MLLLVLVLEQEPLLEPVGWDPPQHSTRCSLWLVPTLLQVPALEAVLDWMPDSVSVALPPGLQPRPALPPPPEAEVWLVVETSKVNSITEHRHSLS